MWEPRRLTTQWASVVCYRDSFAFFCSQKQVVAMAMLNFQVLYSWGRCRTPSTNQYCSHCSRDRPEPQVSHVGTTRRQNQSLCISSSERRHCKGTRPVSNDNEGGKEERNDEQYYILECDAVQPGRSLPTFLSLYFLRPCLRAKFTLWHWRWRQSVNFFQTPWRHIP
jgi:hypothetical protein